MERHSQTLRGGRGGSSSGRSPVPTTNHYRTPAIDLLRQLDARTDMKEVTRWVARPARVEMSYETTGISRYEMYLYDVVVVVLCSNK